MNDKKAKIEKTVKARKKPGGSQKEQKIPSDVLGSYTGVPEDGGRPIQDADDL